VKLADTRAKLKRYRWIAVCITCNFMTLTANIFAMLGHDQGLAYFDTFGLACGFIATACALDDLRSKNVP
jgi:hypothetical protein